MVTIHLIVEDPSDAEVVNAILRAKQLAVRVKVKRSTVGGISRLAKELRMLIQSAQADCGPTDSIVVLHDADELVQPDRRLYVQIAELCEQHPGVIELVARDEIEAWLLADRGVCAWLDIKAENCDRQRKPSARLDSLVKKKVGRGYSGSVRLKVYNAIDGTGDEHSPSLQKALGYLKALSSV